MRHEHCLTLALVKIHENAFILQVFVRPDLGHFDKGFQRHGVHVKILRSAGAPPVRIQEKREEGGGGQEECMKTRPELRLRLS